MSNLEQRIGKFLKEADKNNITPAIQLTRLKFGEYNEWLILLNYPRIGNGKLKYLGIHIPMRIKLDKRKRTGVKIK